MPARHQTTQGTMAIPDPISAWPGPQHSARTNTGLGARPCHDAPFDYLFNVFDKQIDRFHLRSERGLLSRPAIFDIVPRRTCADEPPLLERT